MNEPGNTSNLPDPVSSWSEQGPLNDSLVGQPRVIVKFEDNAELPASEFTGAELLDQFTWHAAPLSTKVVFKPHFRNHGSEQINQLVQRAKRLTPGYQPSNFLNFRHVDVEDEQAGRRLARELTALAGIDFAYLHPGPIEPPAPEATNNPLSTLQLYLDPEPVGIDARYAWTVLGGNGENQQLGDVEMGWNIQHTDLAGIAFKQVAVGYQKYLAHGTKVLGVIASRDNASLCEGITPALNSIVTVGQWRSTTDYVTDEAVIDAIAELNPGDVLLLEAQTTFNGIKNVPLESEPAVFCAVELAIATEIVVIEAAGNNGLVNLDSVQDESGNYIFDRKTRDSGAIIVASASMDACEKWHRFWTSCYGGRVDCFAHGENVVTLSTTEDGVNINAWSNSFGETSSAASIVAGAALALQGVASKRYGAHLTPLQIRDLLSCDLLNTASAFPQTDLIGVMPNLRQIIDSLPTTKP